MRLILISNRLPVTVTAEGGEVAVVRSAGGLATGLRGAHERSGGAWIGWPGDTSRMSDEERSALDSQLAELRCVPVHLSPAEVTGYYDGFSNAVLWPLFHYLLDRIPPTSQEWEAYRSVNEKFAEAAARVWQPGDLVWVHDYQLVLVPAMLRARIPSALIGFFLHTPFPASEILRILPWRQQVLDGLLGADLLGFHTFTYRSHFASSVLSVLGLPTQGDCLYVDGREIRLGVFPIGVDAHGLAELAADPEVLSQAAAIRAQAAGEKILLGIDRLDYTKGIPRRLLAFERLLEREPHWRGKVRMVQIAVPSRDNVPTYQEFRRQVDELIGRINGAFSTVDWVPIHYVHRALDEKHVAALYRAADAMLVTPLRDGMNLVAKEFVTCRTDEDGVLVLSEFAGAAAEMGEALQVNPYDIESMSEAFADALTMPPEERHVRMRALRQRIASRDVTHWAESYIAALSAVRIEDGPPQATLSSGEELAALSARLRSAERLMLLLDYDGTLVPFARAPDLAVPDRELRDLLAELSATPGVRVHVMSGRCRENLERWLGDLPIGLHAEHGYWSRMAAAEPWVEANGFRAGWQPTVQKLMAEITARTPGSLVEAKTASLAWHWRMAEPELGARAARELWRRLEEQLRDESVDLVRGEKVVGVRAREVNKTRLVHRILAAAERPLPTIAAFGDESSDDDGFRALPPEAATISVGFRPATTRYRVATPQAARALLASVVAERDGSTAERRG
ncbi:MAG: bifunctional alpha,alpha-trehalose-phosphate synthase (UDP-forming)/trehalose-phosphatase [Myxococcota bacterium]|nr:bifunctional alpha,alpha-trehalose-phosphate synthase (UDP-forming)/trehalose-phosphatase [Myxococcota bacterium]